MNSKVEIIFLEICSSALVQGCEEHLSKWFENNIFILSAISISLLITQVRVLLIKKPTKY